MPKNVIVVGTPRSGTSLAASIFARQGYFVANDANSQLRSPDHYNPGGYWEAEPLIEANVSLFKRVGYEHHNTWVRDEMSADQAAAISALEDVEEHRSLVAKYEKNHPWVWKDPRLCFTLGYWWRLVDQENTAVLLVSREPEEIFRSFARIGWREDTAGDRQATFNRMADHIAAAQEAIRVLQIPHVEVNYADYRQDPQRVAALLSDEFGLTLSVVDLGFTDSFSSSTAQGKFRIAAEKAVRLIPLPARNGIRRVAPRALLRKLCPGRDKR
jgi:hypothetical protein